MASFLKMVKAMFGSKAKATVTAEEINRINFKHVKRDDPAMMAAVQQARDSVSQFVAMLNDPAQSGSEFHVRKGFVDGDRSETMWLSDVRLDGEEFVGLIGNDPQILTHLQYGAEARVAMTEIRDWMVLEGDEMHGGFTAKVAR